MCAQDPGAQSRVQPLPGTPAELQRCRSREEHCAHQPYRLTLATSPFRSPRLILGYGHFTFLIACPQGSVRQFVYTIFTQNKCDKDRRRADRDHGIRASGHACSRGRQRGGQLRVNAVTAQGKGTRSCGSSLRLECSHLHALRTFWTTLPAKKENAHATKSATDCTRAQIPHKRHGAVA